MQPLAKALVIIGASLAALCCRAQCYEFTAEGGDPVVTADLSHAQSIEGPMGSRMWANPTSTLYRGSSVTSRSTGGMFTVAAYGVTLAVGSPSGDGWAITLIGPHPFAATELPVTLPPPAAWQATAFQVVEHGRKPTPMKLASIVPCKRLYVFIGGFFDEAIKNNVEPYYNAFRKTAPPNSQIEYRTWDQGNAPSTQKLLQDYCLGYGGPRRWSRRRWCAVS